VLSKINATDYNTQWTTPTVYETLGAAASAVSAHEGAADPHPQYLTTAEGNSSYAPVAHVGSGGTTHANATGSVAGFMSAADKTKIDGVASGATANASDSALRDRTTHTGTQSLDTTTDSATRLAMTSAERTKLSGIAAGATANATDSALRDRATHTGTQTSSTISDFTTSVATIIGAASIDALFDVVITSPSNGQVLKYNGTNWVNGTDATGGGGTPAGSNTQIQFNNSGAFGADADFTWDSATNVLSLGGADTGVLLKGVTNEPANPAADTARFYARTMGGRTFANLKGPSGVAYALQAALWGNTTFLWTPTTAAAGLWTGTAGAGAGTYTTQLPTTGGTNYQATKRARYANVVTTTNQVLGQRNTEAMFFRGSAAGQGGFFFFARCGFDVWTNGGRFFAGMHSATTVVSADPSALNNTVGFCVDAADNGAISFLTRGTAATKASTGLTITSNKGYDLYIFCAPNSSQYTWRIVDINTGTEASGTATLNLPTNTTLLTAGVLASNAALTPVTSIHLGVNRIYVETDY
jgi:hypothetical protein